MKLYFSEPLAAHATFCMALWAADRTPEDSPVGTPTTTPFGNSFRGFTYVAPSFLNSPPASPAQA